jgi:hypothetical protein
VKLFQLNLISALMLILGLSAFILIPSFFLQVIWNAVYSNFIERDLTIEIWQASFLWGAIVSAVYLSGIVRIDFQTVDSIDLDSIDDPELKEKILRLKEEKAAERSLRGGDLDPKRREEIIEHLKRSFAMTPDDIQELRKQMTDRLKDHEDGFDKKDKKKDEDL